VLLELLVRFGILDCKLKEVELGLLETAAQFAQVLFDLVKAE